MKTHIQILALISILTTSTIFSSCNEEEIDDQKPVIDLDFAGAFPMNCDTLYFGESFTFTARFTDNVELGSYNLSIHNNFDHHSHSHDVHECEMFPEKEPVNPYTFIQDYNIPEGSIEYTASQTITIPAGNTDGEFDDGDYHFFVSVTDKEGWSVQQGISVKILRR